MQKTCFRSRENPNIREMTKKPNAPERCERGPAKNPQTNMQKRPGRYIDTIRPGTFQVFVCKLLGLTWRVSLAFAEIYRVVKEPVGKHADVYKISHIQ